MNMKNYLNEAVGTFIFVFSIALAVAHAGALAPLAIGGALMCVVYMGGHISGGHYNPAVTLAVYLRGGIEGRAVMGYMLAQLFGAFAAAIGAAVVTHTPLVVAPGPEFSIASALLVETVFTFALALVVLNVATDDAVKGNSFYGLAIGGVIVVAAFVAGPVSGGAFNPAVGIGPALASMGTQSLGHVWIYAAGPLIGGALAAFFYRLQHPVDGVKP